MSETYILDLPPDRMEGEVTVVYFFEDDRPLNGAAALLDWRLNGRLTELLLSGSVTGRSGEAVIFENNGKFDAEWALFLGGGKRTRLSINAWQGLLKKGFRTCENAGFERVAFCLDSHPDVPASQIRAIAMGLLAKHKNTSLECLFSFDTVPVLDLTEKGKQVSLL